MAAPDVHDAARRGAAETIIANGEIIFCYVLIGHGIAAAFPHPGR